MSKYKIGEFANFLGVTPDLIKHYEKYEIIKGEQDISTNYRYYDISQASPIMYSKMYQNMGFTLKEISNLLKEPNINEFFSELNKKKEKLKFQIDKENLVYFNLQEIIKYQEEIINNEFDGCWEIKDIDDFYFFEHTDNYNINKELKNKKLIDDWINLLPITSLCTRIFSTENNFDSVSFGLSCNGKIANKFGIDNSEHLIKINKKKFLVYKSKLTAKSGIPYLLQEKILKKPLELAKNHNLEIKGDIYAKILFQTDENGENFVFRIIYLPI